MYIFFSLSLLSPFGVISRHPRSGTHNPRIRFKRQPLPADERCVDRATNSLSDALNYRVPSFSLFFSFFLPIVRWECGVKFALFHLSHGTRLNPNYKEWIDDFMESGRRHVYYRFFQRFWIVGMKFDLVSRFCIQEENDFLFFLL